MARSHRGPDKTCLLIVPFTDLNGEHAAFWEQFAEELSARFEAALPGYRCESARVGTGPIFDTVIQRIVAADLIVCDLTHLKPNVVFELGISLLLGKQTILLVHGNQQLPSDFSNIAYLPYQLRDGSAVPDFSENLFASTLQQIESGMPGSLGRYTSPIGRSLASISCLLKHALQLEERDSILAPVLRSLLDQLIVEHAAALTQFLEDGREAVTIKVDSPGILFEVLMSLLGGLGAGDRYDSVTWRKHWSDTNRSAATKFLHAIQRRGDDLPAMRRIFLMGIVDRDEDGQWLIDRSDLDVLASYNELVGSHARIAHRFLFLPAKLVELVADRCHMGKITRNSTVIYVFSRYSPAGVLDSFEISRGNNLPWSFDNLWELAREVPSLTLKGPLPSCIAGEHLSFYGSSNRIRYRFGLRSLLAKLGVPEVAGIE